MHPAPPFEPSPRIEIVSTRPWFRKSFEGLSRTLRLDARAGAPCALVVLDLGGLDDERALAELRSCRDTRPGARVACAIDEIDDALAEGLIASGAAGVLIKASPPAVLVEALQLVLDGGTCRPAPTVDVPAPDVPPALRAALSAREQRMLRGIAGGRSIASVARELHLTPERVVRDVRRITELVRGRKP